MDNEKYLEQLTQELQAKQEKEKDITAAVEYASNLLKLHLPVIFDRKHFALLTGCELSEITKMMALTDSQKVRRDAVSTDTGYEIKDHSTLDTGSYFVSDTGIAIL